MHGHSGWLAASSTARNTAFALLTRLAVLVVGLRVGDRAAAGLDVDDAVLDHRPCGCGSRCRGRR